MSTPGHSDVLMGIACTNDDKIAERFKFMQIGKKMPFATLCNSFHTLSTAAGAIPGPFDCYLANRGLKTLHVRMRQHEQNAFAVAHFLQSSPYVEETIYPGELPIDNGGCKIQAPLLFPVQVSPPILNTSWPRDSVLGLVEWSPSGSKEMLRLHESF